MPVKKVLKYGVYWSGTEHPLWMELFMIQKGGSWKKKNGEMAGNGLFYHFREAIKICWPHIKFHAWLDLFIENYLTHRTLVALGPASSGKTCGAALCSLIDYYPFPSITTTIICSTTKERLEDRIWGEMKSLHKMAKERFSWLPGNLIEGRQRLVTDNRADASDGRDFRNGIVGVPALVGGSYQGLGSFAGIKNKRVRLMGDEVHLLPRIFADAISNLDKNPDFKAVALGNPKETTDALGILGEPAAHLGGWESGIDQTPKTKTWPIRRKDGICIQFVGTDSPNLDGKLGIPLITQEQIDRDISFYGKDSLWFTMMDQGMMPRGQGSRRVITRQMCDKFHAHDEPVWKNSNRKRIAGLDAAYRGVGGDRCVLIKIEFGEEGIAEESSSEIAGAIINQVFQPRQERMILAITDVVIVPISALISDLPEDQIVSYVKNECEKSSIPPEHLFFDAGMRTSLVTAFSRLWSPRVNSIDFGGRPSDNRLHHVDIIAKDYYSKRVSELWFNVRHIIETNQFRGMTEDIMMEGCSREWKMVAGNKIEVEAKTEMKQKTGRSPDLFDALVCAVHGAIQLGFPIRKLSNKEQTISDNRWKRELKEKTKSLSHSLNYA